mmetsp:Transcript_25424/g.61241  ORF Transcript_25424/g.61241 Transcript_25424/m.61241 type:complete len:83 (+) Transcript_25424:1115-1363(+)
MNHATSGQSGQAWHPGQPTQRQFLDFRRHLKIATIAFDECTCAAALGDEIRDALDHDANPRDHKRNDPRGIQREMTMKHNEP